MKKKITLGTIVFLILVVTYNLSIQIMNAVRSGDRLYDAAERVYLLEAKNKELKKRLLEIQSTDFIEQEARNKLGLGKSEETVVIIPEDKIKLILGTSTSSVQPKRLANWVGWFRVFF